MGAEEDFHEAENRIETARDTGSQKVDLSDLKDLAQIPPGIEQITDLREFKARNTDITDLTPLASLSGLHLLDVSHTGVRDVTAITNHRQLTSLNISASKVADLSDLAGFNQLSALGMSDLQVHDLSPLQALHALTSLIAENAPIQDLSPLRGLANLGALQLAGSGIRDISALSQLDRLETLNLANTPIRDLNDLPSRARFKTLNVAGTQVEDLRPICAIRFVDTLGSLLFGALFRFLGQKGLVFHGTPATQSSATLEALSLIESDEERTRKTLDYLRTLPPPPAPLPWQNPDPAPPSAPGPRLAPLMVEMRDGQMQAVSPGTGLEPEAEQRARQGWDALRNYLRDLQDLRNRMNNMPNLQRAIQGLERALGDEFTAMNPVDVGMQGDRVIRLSAACDTYLMDQDPEEVRAMAAQVALYLQRFQSWEAFRQDAPPRDITPDTMRAGGDDLHALSQAVQEEDWIDDQVKDPLTQMIEESVADPQDPLAARAALFSVSNVLDQIVQEGVRVKVDTPGSVRGGLIVAGGTAVTSGAVAFLMKHPVLLQRLSHTFNDTLAFLDGFLRFLI